MEEESRKGKANSDVKSGAIVSLLLLLLPLASLPMLQHLNVCLSVSPDMLSSFSGSRSTNFFDDPQGK